MMQHRHLTVRQVEHCDDLVRFRRSHQRRVPNELLKTIASLVPLSRSLSYEPPLTKHHRKCRGEEVSAAVNLCMTLSAVSKQLGAALQSPLRTLIDGHFHPIRVLMPSFDHKKYFSRNDLKKLNTQILHFRFSRKN